MNTVFDNVVSLADLKHRRARREREESFRNYLGSLNDDQLHIEATHYMQTIQNDTMDDEDLRRIALLMDELAARVEVDSMTKSIQDFANNIRFQLDDEGTQEH